MSSATIVLFGAALFVGIVYGVIRGGRLVNLASSQLRWWPVFFVGVGLVGFAQAVPDLSFDAGPLMVTSITVAAAGLIVLVGYVLRNLHLVGAPIIAIGLLANIAGIAANNGVSVDPQALVRAHIATPATLSDLRYEGPRHLRNGDDRVWWLGDVIPLRELEHIMTFGDLVVLLGLADVAANLTKRRRIQQPVLSSEARAGLLSIAATDYSPDDEPVIDLALLAQAASEGYASRLDDGLVLSGHDEREAGPRLRHGTESLSGVGVPVLGQS